MIYKIEKECKPCIVCKNTGWKLISICTCDGTAFDKRNALDLMKYWINYHGNDFNLRFLLKKKGVWKVVWRHNKKGK